MYIDKRLQVSSEQALTASAASTDVIDLGSDRNIGPGEPLWLCVAVREALAGTTPTIKIEIETDDNSGFASAAKIAASPTFSGASEFPAGKMVVIPVPYQNERYLRAYYTLGGTTPTAKVDAFFTNQEPKSWEALPDAL